MDPASASTHQLQGVPAAPESWCFWVKLHKHLCAGSCVDGGVELLLVNAKEQDCGVVREGMVSFVRICPLSSEAAAPSSPALTRRGQRSDCGRPCGCVMPSRFCFNLCFPNDTAVTHSTLLPPSSCPRLPQGGPGLPSCSCAPRTRRLLRPCSSPIAPCRRKGATAASSPRFLFQTPDPLSPPGSSRSGRTAPGRPAKMQMT